jgi:hypothetical protein
MVHAATTWLQMKECPNCTAIQMQTMAKNSMPPGINFVYDLPHHVIRKYEVYWDSTCSPVGGPQVSVAPHDGADSHDDPGTDCGSFKAADEWTPVDASIQAPFDALYHVWQVNPTLAKTGRAMMSAPMPVDTATMHPYDLRYVAWDYPTRSYIRFWADITGQLSTPSGANALSPGLGDDIYGWSVASIDIGAVLGEPAGAIISLIWDRSSTVKLVWYVPPDNDRVEITITRSGTGVVSFHFDGIYDIDDNLYPSSDGTSPLDHGSSSFPHHGGDHFSEGMAHNGVNVPDMPECGYAMHPYQVITRDGSHHIIGVAYSCVPN